MTLVKGLTDNQGVNCVPRVCLLTILGQQTEQEDEILCHPLSERRSALLTLADPRSVSVGNDRGWPVDIESARHADWLPPLANRCARAPTESRVRARRTPTAIRAALCLPTVRK